MKDWDLTAVQIQAREELIFSATETAQGDWRLLAPEGGELKRYETTNYFRDLAEIEIQIFIDDPAPLAEYRLDPPDYQVTLRSDEREEVLRFGIFPPSATDELTVDAVYALRPDEMAVFSVEPRLVSLLHRDFSELLEPALTPAAATDTLTPATGSVP